MCTPLLALGALAVGASVAQGVHAADAQKKAAQQAQKQAAADALKSTEQFNSANQKSPDIAGMLSRNQEAANQGLAATFLTGPGGVASNSLSLGKTSLLGGAAPAQ